MAEEPKKNQIKDLTGRPNSKLTPAQRRNKKQAEAGQYTDINYDGVPDRDQLDMGALNADLQWVANIVDADPALRAIFEDHVRKGSFDPEAGRQGIANFQNDIIASTWWQENNEFARSAFAQKMTDPAAYATRLEDAQNLVRQEAMSLGVQVPPEEIAKIAESVVADGWDQPDRAYKLQERLSQFIDSTMAGGAPTGDLRSYASQLRNTATANGLQFDDNYYNSYAKSVASGLMSIDDAEAEIRQQAAGLWPSYSEKILAGYNDRDLASGYIYTMANELEIDPQSISLDDGYIRSALTGIDEKGNPRPKSLWEFQRELRNDPRWPNTNKAQNQISSMTSRVMEMFGLVG